MDENENILDLMVKDHYKISELLNNVAIGLQVTSESVEDSFTKFKWELEKHFQTEEKAIFMSYNPPNVEDYNMVPILMKEHEIILDMLKEMEKNLENNQEIELVRFQEILMAHKNFEEETFYPKLDQELEQTTKREIIDKIKTPVR